MPNLCPEPCFGSLGQNLSLGQIFSNLGSGPNSEKNRFSPSQKSGPSGPKKGRFKPFPYFGPSGPTNGYPGVSRISPLFYSIAEPLAPLNFQNLRVQTLPLLPSFPGSSVSDLGSLVPLIVPQIPRFWANNLTQARSLAKAQT